MEHRFKKAYDIYETSNSKFIVVLYTSKISTFSKENLTLISEYNELKHPSYVDISPDGDNIAVKNTSGHIAVFSVNKQTCIARNKLTGKEGKNIFFHEDGENIISCDCDGNICTYKYRENQFSISKVIEREDFGLINTINKIDDEYYFYFDKGMVQWEFPFGKTIPKETSFDSINAFFAGSNVKYCEHNQKTAISKRYERRVLLFNHDKKIVEKQILLNNIISYIDWSADGKYILITCLTSSTIKVPMVDYKGTIIYSVPEKVGNIIIMKIDDGTIVKDLHVEHARFTKFAKDMKSIFVGTYSEVYSLECEL